MLRCLAPASDWPVEEPQALDAAVGLNRARWNCLADWLSSRTHRPTDRHLRQWRFLPKTLYPDRWIYQLWTCRTSDVSSHGGVKRKDCRAVHFPCITIVLYSNCALVVTITSSSLSAILKRRYLFIQISNCKLTRKRHFDGTNGNSDPRVFYLPVSSCSRSWVCCFTLPKQRLKICVSRRGGAGALVSVFVIEDREQDAIHRSSVGDGAHWSGAR
jgi:hypothetical protein